MNCWPDKVYGGFSISQANILLIILPGAAGWRPCIRALTWAYLVTSVLDYLSSPLSTVLGCWYSDAE